MLNEKDNPTIANGMGLQSLLDEPLRLSREAERLNIELESLVMDNYKVFVENLTCSVHLRSEDKKLGDISGTLDKNLHDLSAQCFAFKDKVNQFVSSHKRNRKTLQHHMQLVELLEVPQLVDACSRNGFHDEALELANFVNGLERRHLLASEVKSLNGKLRGGSGVIQGIVDDVHQTLATLRQQLLQQLTENTTLPKEIQILATLRKLDGLLIDRHLSHERHESELAAATTTTTTTSSGTGTGTGTGIAASHNSNSEYNMKLGKGMTDEQRDLLRQHYAQCSEIRLQMDFLEARTIWLHRMAERTAPLHHTNPLTASKQQQQQVQQETEETAPATPSATIKGGSGHSTAALGPYGKAIEMLETRRTAWFAIVTQFNALFQDSNNNNSSSSSGVSSGVSDGSNGSRAGRGGGGSRSAPSSALKAAYGSLVWDALSSSPVPVLSPQNFSTAAVLNAWATRQVNHLLRELQALLPQIEEGASLRAVLEQALFFASRMSQVGCDFSGLLEPLFHDVILSRFARDLRRAVKNFKIMLLTERISAAEAASAAALGVSVKGASEIAALNKDQLIPLYSAQDSSATTTAQSSNNTSTSRATELSAPQLLMRFPPIAYLLNAILSGLNFLRECPMVSVEQPAAMLIFQTFADVCEYLVDKAADVRTIGEKYLGDIGGYKGTKKKTSRKDAANDGKSSQEMMDRQYARGIALEMSPHVLVCFDSIFQTNITKMEAKLKALKAKAAVRAAAMNAASTAAATTTGSATGGIAATAGSDRGSAVKKQQLTCLLKNLYDAKDLLDADAVQRLECVWIKLVDGGLLDATVLEKEYKPPVTSTVPVVASATSTTTATGAATGDNAAVPFSATNADFQATVTAATGSTASVGATGNSANNTIDSSQATATADQPSEANSSTKPTPVAKSSSGWDADDFGEDF